MKKYLGWAAVAAGTALVVAGCGGGGGGGGGGSTVTPDARNGQYQMVAVDGSQYVLDVDLNALTYRVTGQGYERSGVLAVRDAATGQFDFDKDNSLPARVPSPAATLRIRDGWAAGTISGAAGAAQAVGMRAPLATLAAAAGDYNVITAAVTTNGGMLGGGFNGATVTGAITARLEANGVFSTCSADPPVSVATCPGASLAVGTFSVANGVYTAVMPGGNFNFRVAEAGSGKVLLRGDAAGALPRTAWFGASAVAGDVDIGMVGPDIAFAYTNAGQWAHVWFNAIGDPAVTTLGTATDAGSPGLYRLTMDGYATPTANLIGTSKIQFMSAIPYAGFIQNRPGLVPNTVIIGMSLVR